jgi:hypothetical protein
MHTYHVGQEITFDVHPSFNGGLLGPISLPGRIVEVERHKLTLLIDLGSKIVRLPGVLDTNPDLRPRA